MRSGQLQVRGRAIYPSAPDIYSESLCAFPKILRLTAALPDALCAELIAAARPRLSPSLVEHPNGRAIVNRSNRRSESAEFGGHCDGGELAAEVAVHLALSPDALLDPHVVRYGSGGFFKPHHDHGHVADSPVTRRAASFVCFLNDDFEGGELDFPLAGVRAAAARGDAIVFDNVDAERCRIDAALHAGRPVLSGEKWILVFWTSERLGANLWRS